MMDQNPDIDWCREEMEAMSYIPLDLDFDLLMEVLDSDIAHPSLPLPYYAPAEEEFGPQQPQTENYMPPGAAPFSLQQPVMPAHGFHAAKTNPPLPPPYYAPAEEEFGPQQPQTEYFMPPGAAPFSLQQPVMPAPVWPPPMYQPPTDLQPNYMYIQAAPFSYSQVNNVPVTLPQGRGTNLAPIRLINGNFVYGVPAYTAPPVASDGPEVKAHASQKRKFDRKPGDESRLYITKPPNAFMIFRREQRPKVVAEIQNPECAAVNRVIGQRWRSLSKEEQANYYKDADRERQLHSQLFPEWSASDNYGVKKKRIRRKGPALTEYSVI